MPRRQAADRARPAGLPAPTLPAVAAVAAGGALGTLGRYGIDRVAPSAPTGFPWATVVTILGGSFLFGLVVALATERWSSARHLRPFAAAGLCGSFGSFSVLSVESTLLAQHHRLGTAVLALAGSLLLGVLAAAAGVALGRRGARPAQGCHGCACGTAERAICGSVPAGEAR